MWFQTTSSLYLAPTLKDNVIVGSPICTKALQNWKISVKALSKWLQKLTIITKPLITIIIVSFVNINDKQLTINY